MPVPITHAKTVTIPDPTQAELDAQIALGNYPPGTVLADIALASDYNDDHVISTTGASEGYVLKVVGGEAEWAVAGTGSALYLSTAFTSQTSVTVTHNFGAHPLVNVFDNAGAVLIPLTITHGSLNAFTVTFSISTTGTILSTAGGAGGGTPGGSSGQMQWNNGGAFAGAAFSNVATSGTHLRLTAQTATDIPLVARAATSQTANVQEWQTSAGTAGVYVDNTANSIYAATNVAAGNSFFFYLRNLLMSWRAATLGDSGNAYTFADSGGTTLRQIKASTLMLTTNNTDTLATSTRFAAVCGSTGQIGGIFRGASGQTAALIDAQDNGGTTMASISAAGKMSFDTTITAGGTTGARTINKPSGTVNFAAAASSLVVTNSLCTTSSIVMCVVRTNDTTASIKNVVPAAGSFTINLEAAATAETSVGFIVYN